MRHAACRRGGGRPGTRRPSAAGSPCPLCRAEGSGGSEAADGVATGFSDCKESRLTRKKKSRLRE